MNINNFDSPDEYPKDMLEDIFKKQKELAEKYHPIEAANGFRVGTGLEVGIHDKFGQHRIKDFAWRITEELMEAKEAWDKGDIDHCQEEVSDALHFMVELCIITGHDADYFMFDDVFLKAKKLDYPEAALSVVYFLGLACNCLKNKPWKQTQMLTDVRLFSSYLHEAFGNLMVTAIAAGINTPEEMYDLYFRKNKVNQFRQESKY